jgi:hypothetical protein
MINPSGRTLVLADTEETVELIDTPLIASIYFERNGEPEVRSRPADEQE